MNHNYHPMNPSPFTQQHPSGGYTPTSSVNGATGPGIPSHSSQYYPMHPTYPPAPHGFAPYYPQQMMMYGAPRSSTSVPEQSQPSSAPSPTLASAPAAIGKRKRKLEPSRNKVTVEKDSDQEGPSGSDVPAKRSTPTAATPTISDSKKRTKTQRACDSCRSRKIRCGWVFSLVLSDSPTRCLFLSDATFFRTRNPHCVNIVNSMGLNAHSSCPSQKRVLKRKNWKKRPQKKKRRSPRTLDEIRRLLKLNLGIEEFSVRPKFYLAVLS